MRRISIFLASFLCTSCMTQLTVQRVDETKPSTRVGVPYPLLFTRYEVAITRQVAGCGPEMKALIKVEIKSADATPDPKQLFVLDPNSLASPVKTSDVKLEYLPNGAVSSLNASAEDRSAQVIANTVATAVKIVSIAAAAGAGVGGAAPEACSKAVLAARKVVTTSTPIVEAATKLVDARTEETNAVSKKITSMGTSVDERTKAALSKAYDLLVVAIDNLDDKQKVLDKALKAITYVETVRWPESGDVAAGESEIPPIVLTQWGNLNLNPNTRSKFSVFFRLEGSGPISRTLSVADVVEPKLGVPYRQPVPGRFKVCAGGDCAADNLPIAEKTGDVLQLGYVYYLPCQSRPFTSISCFFTMTDGGQLKTIGTAQKVASAEGLSGAAKDTVVQIGGLQDTLASQKTKKIEAQTAALKAQAELAAAEASLKSDPLQPEKDETAALRASTALLDAKRAQLDAAAALAAAIAKSGNVGQ